jgi:TetR/AcrR family transcriptional repressor of mexJK operon
MSKQSTHGVMVSTAGAGHVRPAADAPARSRGRGRPRDESKRASIVLAAQALFCANGYGATTMEAIAEHAGVSKLTVYNQFGSKQDVFVSAVTTKCAEMLAPLDLAATGHMAPRRALIAVGDTFLGLLLSPEAVAMFRLIMQEQSSELSELFYRSAIQPTIEQVASVIAGFEPDARLSVGDPRQASHDYLDLVKGRPFLLSQMGLPPMGQSELERHVEHCADLMLRAWTRPAVTGADGRTRTRAAAGPVAGLRRSKRG